jgi:hypothetical protein
LNEWTSYYHLSIKGTKKMNVLKSFKKYSPHCLWIMSILWTGCEQSINSPTPKSIKPSENPKNSGNLATSQCGQESCDKSNNNVPILLDNTPTTTHLSQISYLKLEKSGGKSYANLNQLTLSYYSKGKLVEAVEAVSGQANAQSYTTKKAPGKAGNNKPVPEGLYFLGKPVISGKAGIGKWFVPIVPDPKPRSAFGIHLDANRPSSPGTAGCVGLPTSALMTTVMGWLDRADKPTLLLVDWNLGTVNSIQKAITEGKDISTIKSEGGLGLATADDSFPYDRVPTELVDVDVESILTDAGEVSN